jgi:hypothetical protein
MTMAQSAHRISRQTGSAPISAFIPALLLSLVLGAALVFRLSPRETSLASSSAATAVPVSASLTNHHADTGGAGIVVPAEWMGDGESGHHMANPRPVAEQLAARAVDVGFCVGSTLEPFDAAWAQLLSTGPGEAGERTRRCLMELVFTHVDPTTAANVRAELPAFSACYQRAVDLGTPNKQQAMAEVTSCLTNLTRR